MSHIFPAFDLNGLLQYVAETVERIEQQLKLRLLDEGDDDDFSCRNEASVRAYELYRLVHNFAVSLHPDVSNKIADLMCNKLFY